jgi:GNAT superfamily N-acetyltransferase
MTITSLRDAMPADIEPLAALWHDGWQDAHAAILPLELARQRTIASFRKRLTEALVDVRMVEVDGRPHGFALTKSDELYQFYVAAEGRGTGIASLLMTDALASLRSTGHARAWLACAIGNTRAARFYEKTGWYRACTMVSELDTPAGVFSLDVWRYEIDLR